MKALLSLVAVCLLSTSAFAHQYTCSGRPESDLQMRLTFKEDRSFVGGYIDYGKKHYEIITLAQQSMYPNEKRATLEDWNLSAEKGFDASIALQQVGTAMLGARTPVTKVEGSTAISYLRGSLGMFFEAPAWGVAAPPMDQTTIRCTYSNVEVDPEHSALN